MRPASLRCSLCSLLFNVHNASGVWKWPGLGWCQLWQTLSSQHCITCWDTDPQLNCRHLQFDRQGLAVVSQCSLSIQLHLPHQLMCISCKLHWSSVWCMRWTLCMTSAYMDASEAEYILIRRYTYMSLGQFPQHGSFGHIRDKDDIDGYGNGEDSSLKSISMAANWLQKAKGSPR